MMRFFVLLLAVSAVSAPASGQRRDVPRDTRVYAGLGVGEGIGVVAFGSSPALDVFTREASFGVVYRPGSDGDAGRLVASFGVGAGLRLLRLASVARSRSIPQGDVDVGVRVGPSFAAGLGTQSEAQRARAFAVFVDPYVRASRLIRGRAAFAEVGAHSPLLRVGLSTAVGR